MSADDLRFELSSGGTTGASEPLSLSVGNFTLYVFNDGLEDLTGVGIYMVPSTRLGELDVQPTEPPEAYFYDVLEYGDRVANGTDTVGGIIITPNGGSATRVSSTAGSKRSNKIGAIDIDAGDYNTFVIALENLTSPISGSFYVDFVVE